MLPYSIEENTPKKRTTAKLRRKKYWHFPKIFRFASFTFGVELSNIIQIEREKRKRHSHQTVGILKVLNCEICECISLICSNWINKNWKKSRSPMVEIGLISPSPLTTNLIAWTANVAQKTTQLIKTKSDFLVCSVFKYSHSGIWLIINSLPIKFNKMAFHTWKEFFYWNIFFSINSFFVGKMGQFRVIINKTKTATIKCLSTAEGRTRRTIDVT